VWQTGSETVREKQLETESVEVLEPAGKKAKAPMGMKAFRVDWALDVDLVGPAVRESSQ